MWLGCRYAFPLGGWLGGSRTTGLCVSLSLGIWRETVTIHDIVSRPPISLTNLTRVVVSRTCWKTVAIETCSQRYQHEHPESPSDTCKDQKTTSGGTRNHYLGLLHYLSGLIQKAEPPLNYAFPSSQWSFSHPGKGAAVAAAHSVQLDRPPRKSKYQRTGSLSTSKSSLSSMKCNTESEF